MKYGQIRRAVALAEKLEATRETITKLEAGNRVEITFANGHTPVLVLESVRGSGDLAELFQALQEATLATLRQRERDTEGELREIGVTP